MSIPPPSAVIWDITYACPLRCSHCYSESGRRPSRRLADGQLLEVVERLVDLAPSSVAFAGGEPLLVDALPDLALRLRSAGIGTAVYTSGQTMTDRLASRVLDTFDHVAVSVDGSTPAVHDAVRGRVGSHTKALRALRLLDQELGRTPRRHTRFGIDFTAVRSNLHQVEEMCTDVVARFVRAGFVAVGAAVPAGLASRPGFVTHELLEDADVLRMGEPGYVEGLRALAPPAVQVSATDNLALMLHPDRPGATDLMTLEADGEVRAFPVYEGTVGNILTEDPVALWARAVARRRDPFIVETLRPVATMAQWAEATRRLDRRFGSAAVQIRLDRRQDFAESLR